MLFSTSILFITNFINCFFRYGNSNDYINDLFTATQFPLCIMWWENERINTKYVENSKNNRKQIKICPPINLKLFQF